MRINKIIAHKRFAEAYVPPRNPRIQRRHKAQLELGKQQAEFQQELIDLKLKRKELEKEDAKVIKSMADRSRQRQAKL